MCLSQGMGLVAFPSRVIGLSDKYLLKQYKWTTYYTSGSGRPQILKHKGPQFCGGNGHYCKTHV